MKEIHRGGEKERRSKGWNGDVEDVEDAEYAPDSRLLVVGAQFSVQRMSFEAGQAVETLDQAVTALRLLLDTTTKRT